MQTEDLLKNLFTAWAGESITTFLPLPPSGSARRYFRIIAKSKNAIGVFNPDRKENEAFISFTEHFLKNNLNVPQIYQWDTTNNLYLMQDLGDTTLFSYAAEIRIGDDFTDEVKHLYKKVIDVLPRFQSAGKDLNFSKSYPRAEFDKQSMMWDLSYFKYYFLKLANIQFDEQHLEDDFNLFTDFLLKADKEYFLYRDFQSRNIMLIEEEPYFIDYQGGRKGALQYDLASLLFDAKANIPGSIRHELLEYYIGIAGKYVYLNKQDFLKYYNGFVLIRILQALGAYGYRGFYERKEHFLKSIPFALENLEMLLSSSMPDIKTPYLLKILKNMVSSDELKKYRIKTALRNSLKVSIYSFSYKTGLPIDDSENGGGFVFDCRAIHNPGRYEQYKSLTGHDAGVIKFFEKESNINEFLTHVYALVDNSVEEYLKRKFSHLMVSFGCTGGQHRSVYSAEMLAKHLKEKYKIEIEVKHMALPK